MRKVLLILVVSFVTLSSLAQIKTSGIFETGYENRRTLIYLPDPVQIQTGLLPTAEFGPYYGFLHVEAELKGFTAYTSNKTYFNKDTEIYFNPQMSEFKIGFYYNHNKITAGYEHLCGHTFEKRTYSEFYDRLYIRIKLF